METTSASILPIEAEMDDNRRAFHLMSSLLQYPEQDWPGVDEFRAGLAELSDPAIVERLSRFLDYVAATDREALAEAYVNTFDFSDKTALYLTYSQLGEERERGQVLVELKELYAAVGLELTSEELPDYLPLFLEFLALAPTEVGRLELSKYTSVMEKIRTELDKMGSPYAQVLEACLIAADQFIRTQEVAP